MAGEKGRKRWHEGHCLIRFFSFLWPARLMACSMKKERKSLSLPYLKGENSNSVFCSSAAARGVVQAEEAGEARTEAAMGAKKSPRVDDDDDVGGGGALPTTVAPLVASREEEAVAPISRRSWLPASHLRADAGVVFSRTREWERGSETVFPLPFSRNFLRERKQKWREIARPRRGCEKKGGGGGLSPLPPLLPPIAAPTPAHSFSPNK